MVTTNPLLKLFGQPTFKPLQEHMRVVVSCSAEVPSLFEALFAGDEDKIKETRDVIFALENEADGLKNQLRSHLPKTLFMPVDRRDILEILDLQDSIADTAQDIAVVSQFEISPPICSLLRSAVQAPTFCLRLDTRTFREDAR